VFHNILDKLNKNFEGEVSLEGIIAKAFNGVLILQLKNLANLTPLIDENLKRGKNP
jgi:hypothetical protein